jgi:hypothetical protein
MFSFLLGIYLEIEFPGHVVTVFNFLGNSQLFPHMAEPFYISTNIVEGLPLRSFLKLLLAGPLSPVICM